MKIKLDTNIHLKILVVDKLPSSIKRLKQALNTIKNLQSIEMTIMESKSISKVYELLLLKLPNIIFIDIISTGVRDSVTLIQHCRSKYPNIVFVLYCEEKQLESNSEEIYSGWGARLKHYFLLEKSTFDSNFPNEVLYNLHRAQLDLYTYGIEKTLVNSNIYNVNAPLTDNQLAKLSSHIQQLVQQLRFSVTPDLIKSKKTDKNISAFVVMYFNRGKGLRDIYKIGIKEFLENTYKINVIRSDERYPPGLIINDIYKNISESDLIIAELTNPRPNCYYELGFADALGKPIIRIARKGTILPFDVNQYPFIFYDDISDLRNKLADVLNSKGFRKKR